MSNSIFINNLLTINQDTDVYGAVINVGEYDYVITLNTLGYTEGNITDLFSNATYKQNSVNPNMVDINLTILDSLNFADWNSTINNQPIATISPGLANIGFGTFLVSNQRLGDLFLEIIAHKLFGHAQARAAIRNDTEFYFHDSQIWNHIGSSFNLNNIKYDIFNQYIVMGRYENTEDINTYINFNFQDLTMDFPLYFSGNIGVDQSLTPDERNNLLNGPVVGGNQIINGAYNIPILLRFI
jgi:hypothetical protein